MNVRIQRADLADLGAIAKLYRATAEREWDFLRPHTPDEDHAHFARSFDPGEVWIARDGETTVGFCAARRGWVDHLYVRHERHGEGIGRRLLARALKGRRRGRLWTIQRNARSRSFYALQRFVEVRLTDGSANEEREPDVLLEWRAV